MKQSSTAPRARTTNRSAATSPVRLRSRGHGLAPIVLTIGMLATSVASAAAGLAHAKNAARPAHASSTAVQPQGGIQFFSDEAAFDAALGIPQQLTVETFDGGQPVGPFPTGCNEPMGSGSNDSCFTPGQLASGFTVTSTSGSGLTIFPTSFLGPNQTSRAVGASTFADATIVSFSPAAAAAAADVFGGFAAGTTVDVEVFDESGSSLGTTTVQPAATRDTPVFFGVVSATPIGKIALDAQSTSTGELLNRLQFRPVGLAPPGVAKAFALSGVAAGEISTLTITLGNQGQSALATLDADLTDTLPGGLVVATPPNASTTCANGSLTASAGAGAVTLGGGAQIPASGTCTVTVDVSSASAGLYANTIPAGALQTDLGSNRDAANATLIVTSGAQNPFPPAENFDEVFAPQLPSGWTTSTSTGANDWITTTTASDTAPNAAFAPGLPAVNDLTLDTPIFTPVAGQNMTFRHRFDLERGFDGAVLEISIGGGEFADIISAGGSFVTGGYAGVTISEFTGNPIGGRPAWTGNSFEFVTTTVNLPTSAVGQPTQLRFRTADDAGTLNTGEVYGWWIDSIALGVSAQAPSASIAPASLNFSVAPDATASDIVTLANASGSDPLTFSIESRGTTNNRPRLIPHAAPARSKNTHADDGKTLLPRAPATLAAHGSGSSRRAASTPWAPQGSLMLQLDDGSAESSLGTGTGSLNPPVVFTEQAAVWINRFHASDALTIQSISVFWPEPAMSGGDPLGLQANLVVYYDADADGDPTNAVRVGADDLVPISVTGDFQTYPTSFSIPAQGDVYIGFVDQWAMAGGFTPRLYPAAVDETQPQGMSYFSSVDNPPVDIVNLGNNDYNEPFTDANLMIRAAVTGGGGGAPCSGPIVNWLTATPTSGSIDGGASASLTVTVNPAAGGLGVGVYSADLCISTNDPAQALISVPVSVTVGTPPPAACSGGSDEVFCDGFETSQGGGGNLVTGTIDQPVAPDVDGSSFDFATASYHGYDPSITTDDINLYENSDGMYAFWYAQSVPPAFADMIGGEVDAGGVDFAVLHSGDSVGPDSIVSGDSIKMTNWIGGADGYLGIAFYNEHTSAVNYGYLHLTTTSPLGFPAQVLEWAYDDSGAAITIP